MTILRIREPYGHFRVTYNTVTEESAEAGDCADSGYLDWLGNPVDDYIDSQWDLRDLTNRLSGYRAEGDGAPVPRWVSIDAESDFWVSSFWRGFAGDDAIGATVSVHRPDWITDASWLRICRLLGLR